MAHQTVLLQLRQRGQRFLDRAFGRAFAEHDPQVDDVHRLEP